MAQSTGGTSSRRLIRDHETASTSSRYADTEWEAKEAFRQRELEEARARATQMEKTMRWWSDCTANWREKWSKVRNERNKAREEVKHLRTKLEAALKDGNCYIRDKQELELQNEQLKKEIEKIHLLLLKHAGQFESQILEALGDDPLKDFNFSTSNEQKEKAKEDINDVTSVTTTTQQECDSTGTSLICLERDSCVEEYVLQGAVPKHLSENKDEEFNGFDNYSNQCCNKEDKDEFEEEYWTQKISMLQLRLDEANTILQTEREEKVQLNRTIERLSNELQEMKEKCEELRQSRQDAVRELLALQDQHQEEIQLIKTDLQDEANSREGMDRRINDLRAELERLQTENASEWGKRERLETDKLSLERENKKLRAELRDIQERLERKERPLSNSDADIRQLQQELSDKCKEMSDLKHSQNKLKKMFQDKITELAHTVRRAEQYEVEVKKLRNRVEELKRDLAVTEDELDTASNSLRKQQRTNDELQEQIDNLQVQIQHLSSSEGKEDGGEEMAVLEDSDCIT